MGARLLLYALALLPSYVVSVPFTCEGPRTQRALLANLTDDYDEKERPHSDGDAVDVEVQIYLTSLTEINQKGQKLGLAGYFRAWWTDPRLAFKSKAEGGCVDQMQLTETEREMIWQPDLYFDNVLEEIYGSSLLAVDSSGNVWKSERINHLFECKMHFENLPYDTQTCEVHIATYSEDVSQVKVSPRNNEGLVQAGADGSIETPVWEIDRVTSRVENRNHSGTLWTYVELEILLRRRPDYYMRGIVLKAFLFVIISWCSFFVNRSVAPARVAIGVIPVLIMMNLMNAVDTFLPPISYGTTLTNFLMLCLVFTSCSVFEYALVSYLLQREARRAEKSKVLAKLNSSYLKKKDGEPPKAKEPIKETVQIPEEEKPEEKRSERAGAERAVTPTVTWRGVRRSDMSAHIPSNIFHDHPVLTEIYSEFDRNKNGRLSVQEMRAALRRFGQFRSSREVREIFARLGVEGDEMNMHQLERFLADPNTYTPMDTTNQRYWDMPRSLQLDIAMRVIYPVVFVFLSGIIWLSLVD